jgi:hypothetical protein
MANTINITNIPAPRVDVIDPRTGLMSAVWYRFFYNMFILTGNGSNEISLEDLQVGPPNNNEFVINLQNEINNINADTSALLSDVFELSKPNISIEPNSNALGATVTELQKQVEGLQSQPSLTPADIITYISAIYTPPVTKTADFAVTFNETWIINNKSGSTCTATLPVASSYIGRTLTFQNYQAQLLVSASSDVVPLGGGAAGVAILTNVVGKWATLVSDGTNWIVMQAA